MECKTKKTFGYRLTRKKLVYQTEISYYFRIILNKLLKKWMSFLSNQELFQINPHSIWGIPRVGRVYEKRNFCNSLRTKKVKFSLYGKLRLIQMINFEI